MLCELNDLSDLTECMKLVCWAVPDLRPWNALHFVDEIIDESIRTLLFAAAIQVRDVDLRRRARPNMRSFLFNFKYCRVETLLHKLVNRGLTKFKVGFSPWPDWSASRMTYIATAQTVRSLANAS